MIPWFYFALSAGAALAQPGGPPRVEVAAVVERELSPTLELVGTVLPNRRSVLSVEVAGMVAELSVQEGDAVAAGQVVCRLQASVRQYELRAAQAELNRLTSVLAEWEAGEREETLDRLKAAHDEAKANLERWEFEKARVGDLKQRGECTAKEYNDTITDYNAAVGRERQAEAALRQARTGTRKEVLAAARHAVEAQQAEVDRLGYELQKTAIASPFTGFVTVKRTEVGQWIEPGGPVVELLEADPARIRVHVPEALVGFNAPGADVEVLIEALNRRVNGPIRRVVPDADPAARTFPVEIEVRNETSALKAGMFARARMRSGPAAPALTIPKDAVVRSPAGSTVWVVRRSEQGDVASPLSVRTGEEYREWIAVAAAELRRGDRVVVRGNERLGEMLHGPGPVLAVEWKPVEEARAPSSQPRTKSAS